MRSEPFALVALLGLAGTADAGGLARPISGSPAAAGMGGAFAAVADDATCVQVNPAGCAFAPLAVLAAIELVVAPRSYVPVDDTGAKGDAQDATAVAPAPVLGVLFQGGPASDFTLGMALTSTFGGILSWEPIPGEDTAPAPPQITDITDLAIELAIGGGYALDDRVAIGAAARLGVGLFHVKAINTAGATNSDLSANGIGVGATAGLTVRATDDLTLAIGWRSDLDISTSGSGQLTPVGAGETKVDVEHVQHWPQSFSLSAALRPGGGKLLLAAQLDWTEWSAFESLDIHFPGNAALDQHFDLDWRDVLTGRLGLEYTASDALALRGGLVYDGNAVPDRTIERQYLDATKYGVAAGASVRLSRRVLLDLALDAVGGPKRTIDDTAMDIPDWEARHNIAPGDHSGSVFTLATGLRVAL